MGTIFNFGLLKANPILRIKRAKIWHFVKIRDCYWAFCQSLGTKMGTFFGQGANQEGLSGSSGNEIL